jgi:Asp-tRNA(Asn)/Glu-tRNA(Gln) amidotransferase A subunit family amidase
MPATAATSAADLGLLEAAALLRSRALSAVELLDACLARVDERNGGGRASTAHPRPSTRG